MGRPAVVFLVLVMAVIGAIAAGAQAAPPGVFASFTWSPSVPLSGQRVTFASISTVTGNNAIASESWDLDGDNEFDDAFGPAASWAYAIPGGHAVGLRVIDTRGNQSVTVKGVAVGNRPPTALVTQSPSAPVPGQVVTFFSTSIDPDGYVRSYAWDLDNDKKFQDGAESLAWRSYPRAGRFAISLRVTDDRGLTDDVEHIVTVGQPPPPSLPMVLMPGAGGTVGTSALPLLNPFPIVRISGLVRRRGIKLRLVAVHAPVGADVKVRCRGRGCPFRRRSTTVRSPTRSTADQKALARLVRIRRFGGGFVPAGARVEVFVTRAGAIGKYTRLKVRRGKLPVRADRCLIPAARLPVRCPGS